MDELSSPNYSQKDALRKICADEFLMPWRVTQIADDADRKGSQGYDGTVPYKGVLRRAAAALSTGLNPNDLSEEKRQAAEKTLLEAVDEAEYLGAKAVAFLAGKWEEEAKEEAYEQLLKTTVNLCRYAETRAWASTWKCLTMISTRPL